MNFIQTTAPTWLAGVNVNYYKHIQYGSINKENLAVIIPSDAVSPTPCIINFHGGSFIFGDKEDIWDDAAKQAIVKDYVDNGICFISVNYELMSVYDESEGLIASMDSATMAVQWIKFYADIFNIDKNNIALMGGSAGAGIAILEKVLPL